MYNQYFGLSATPFSISPDPRYLFMSERHREALAHLLYGLRIDGGFVLLTGEVGTGKTTLCRCLLEQVPEHCDIAFIFNPRLDAAELLRTLCEELHIAVPPDVRSLKPLVDRLNTHLLASNARGRKTVLIVDEAQNLSNEVLELLRLLTNLETSQHKLLQIILLGQPELRERLAAPQLRQLAQRVVARYHLEPLSRQEVSSYVRHRLAVAGARFNLFPPAVLDRLYHFSNGTPRLINLICDRALLGTYVKSRTEVDMATLKHAAHEVLGEEGPSGRPSRPSRRHASARAAVCVAVVFASLAVAVHHGLPPPLPVADAASPAAATVPDDTTPPEDGVDALPRPESPPISGPAPQEQWLHEAQAVRSLLAQWQIEVAQPTNLEQACQRASQLGLYCLEMDDGLSALRRMDTPAIVELRQSDGPDFLATLLALEQDRVRLDVSGRVQEVPVESLARQWNGRYTLLWRTPEDWNNGLALGARDPAVAWIDRRLARWEGVAPRNAAEHRFTEELAQRVRNFQRAHGLKADGVVGQATMARLSSLTDAEAPVLAQQVR